MGSETDADPGDAFAALGNELRVAILRTLAEAAEADRGGLTFTELYDGLAIDSTSQLSYHLGQLEGRFVRKSNDTYVLTQAGERVIRAVRSGTYEREPSFEPTTVEGACPRCDCTTLSVSYRERLLTVACADCDTTVVTYDLPPPATGDRTSEEVLAACDRRARNEYAVAVAGTCPKCGGAMERSVEPADAPATYSCRADCSQCGLCLFAPVEASLLYHAGVIAFLWEHDVDVTSLPFWRLLPLIEEWEVERVGAEPLPLRVTVVEGDDSLVATIDEDLGVRLLKDL
ncbi:ArsR/SmtB family transcription factor [Haloarchaeobius salinus]|uniref:ArsR/SmtB family transcription factor n=1 Tax=Haloarchaeobius salinus TaxID=1198298 RepID=UPI00210C310E|nr:helix-turn-helix domain-containing protein [Haloarchaeobius salinus]